MNFELSEEQKMIRDTVRDFAEREIKPVAKELDETWDEEKAHQDYLAENS